MNSLHTVQASLLAGLLSLGLGGCAQAAQPASSKALVEGNTAFACDLYSRLKDHPGNLFCSPYSISTALAITYAGARGNTEKQIGRVLHFDPDQSQAQIHGVFGMLLRQLKMEQKQNGIELNLANAVWTAKGYPLLPVFLNIGKSEYHASLEQADFQGNAAAAREQINQWVATQTKDRIQNVLPSGSLHASTRLVLANAIYFKGRWASPFEPPQTSTEPFHVSTTRQVKVPLMHQTETVRYLANEQFQAVELPYVGGAFSMVVLLPRQVDGCPSVEKRLSPSLLSNTLRHLKSQEVELFLPRFKMEFSLELTPTLNQMGMTDAFGDRANFSGMDGANNLFISGVYHRAWVEVKEDGTEAAAATAVPMTSAAPSAVPPVFRADRSFLFFIRDTRSGSVLFLGRVVNPSA